MARKIFKFPLRMVDYQQVHIPGGIRVLSTILQNNTPMLYALVDTNLVNVMPLDVYIIGTGNSIPEMYGIAYATFLGTLSMEHGQLIWHIFYQQVE